MKRFYYKAIPLLIILTLVLSSCSDAKISPTETSSTTNALATTALTSTALTSTATSPTTEAAFSKDPNLNPPGQYPICKTPIEITVGIAQNPSVSDYVDNKLTKALESKGNVKLVFEIGPAKDYPQKFEIMASSGSKLPDVVVGVDFSDVALLKYGQNKVIIPLNDYFQNLSFEFKEKMNEVQNKDLLKYMTSADGNIYNFPKVNEDLGNQFPNRGYINKAWLQTLGLKLPTTTDEFYEALKSFKTKDPNGNGKNDEIPYVGYSGPSSDGKPYEWLMNAFIYNDTKDRWIVNNSVLDVAYNKPEWRDGLRYVNKLYSEGLIAPVTFTQDVAQLKTLLGGDLPNKVGMVQALSGSHFGTKDNRYEEYQVAMPLKGPNGVQWATYINASMPQAGLVITRDCKNPEVAFRFADMMWGSDFTMAIRFGEKGVDWVPAEASDVSEYVSLGYKATFKTILVWGSVQKSHWMDAGPTFRSFENAGGRSGIPGVLNPNTLQYPNVANSQDKVPKEIVYNIIYLSDEMDKISDIRNSLNSYVNECATRFVTGDMSIEKDWDAYISELNKIGLKQFVEISQVAYSRTIGK